MLRKFLERLLCRRTKSGPLTWTAADDIHLADQFRTLHHAIASRRIANDR